MVFKMRRWANGSRTLCRYPAHPVGRCCCRAGRCHTGSASKRHHRFNWSRAVPFRRNHPPIPERNPGHTSSRHRYARALLWRKIGRAIARSERQLAYWSPTLQGLAEPAMNRCMKSQTDLRKNKVRKILHRNIKNSKKIASFLTMKLLDANH